jgi:Tol biopolymer transport system component
MAEPIERLRAALADDYALERELGSGGMATVYLARDRRHDRPVAVKVMRPELAMTLGPERFLREIQIAARLSHPHILPVHHSGEIDGFLYYVMPYVEGESLRQRLAREGRLPVPEAAAILREVADALAYAHERGVVHRDIKPDNVLLSGRHALVADFGVAKAVSEAGGRHGLTSAGVALGTPSYMAPEQAAADPLVDYRVDLYALGVLGYEMLSGAPPFSGLTLQETLAAQVTRVPEPITALRPDTPAPFADLVMRCLAKRPAERPASALDLLPILDAIATPRGGVTPTGAETLLPPRPAWWTLAGSALVLLLAGAAVLATRGRRDWHPVTLGTQSRITDAPGLETDPVISPDGRFIAYAAGPYFSSHIYVRQVSGGPAIDITPTLPGRHTRPRWSPGGDRLLFVTSDGRTRRVSAVSALGGTPGTLVEFERDETIASADWSPDGKRLAYDLGGAIYLRRLGDTTSTQVYEGADPHSLSWSPDGRSLAFVEGASRTWHGATGLSNTAPSAILTVPVTGGAADTIAMLRDGVNLSPSWGPRGRSLFFISSRDGAEDIYQMPLGARGRPAGPPVRLTTGLDAYTVAMSRDGHYLTFSTLVREANIWMVPLRPGRTITDDSAVPITTGNQVIERVSVSADGHWLVYDSNRPGNAEIYRLNLAQPGAEPERLTSDSADDYAPAISTDDREILFHSLRGGSRDLWVMNADGTNQRPITHSTYDEYAGYWSPDGRSVSFYSDSGAALWLGLLSRDASGTWGTPRLVLSGVPGQASWSPDGKTLAATHDGVISLIDVATGQARPIEPEVTTSAGVRQALWAPDGKSLYYRGREPDGRLTLFQLFLDGRPGFPLVRPRDASRATPRADWATDGRHLFYTITRYEGDISVVEVKP